MTAARRVAAAFVAGLLLAALATGCAGGKKKQQAEVDPVTLSARAAYEQGMELLSRRKLRQARTTLERIQFHTDPDARQEIEPLARLALADATFYQGTDLAFIDARSLYLDYVTLYGSHALAPYAQLQAGLCSLEQVNHPSRDQTQTLQAVSDLQVIGRRWPSTRYAVAAGDLLAEARANLAEHEFLVGRFYLKRKAYAAATERFRVVLERYPDFDEREKVLFHIAEALRLGGNALEGRVYLDQLVTRYPDGDYADEARKVLAAAAGGKLSSRNKGSLP